MSYFIATATTLNYSLATFAGAALVGTLATYFLARWRIRGAYILLVLLCTASLVILARLLNRSLIVSVVEEHGWFLVTLVYAEIILIGLGPVLVVARQRRLNRT